MAIKPLLLLGKGSMVPVAVQARFTDGGDSGIGRQLHDPRPVAFVGLGHVVGLDADGREDARMFAAISITRRYPRPWCRSRRSEPAPAARARVENLPQGRLEAAIVSGGRGCRRAVPHGEVGSVIVWFSLAVGVPASRDWVHSWRGSASGLGARAPSDSRPAPGGIR